MCKISTVDITPELKNNVLDFGYGVNFKYEGMLYHSFDRFYVVTKFEIPKVEDLKLTTFVVELTCEHLNNPKSYIHKYLKHCQKIAPYVEKEIGLILPTYNKIKEIKGSLVHC